MYNSQSDGHFKGAQSKPKQPPIYCETCCSYVNSASQAEAHFNGKVHQRNLAMKQNLLPASAQPALMNNMPPVQQQLKQPMSRNGAVNAITYDSYPSGNGFANGGYEDGSYDDGSYANGGYTGGYPNSGNASGPYGYGSVADAAYATSTYTYEMGPYVAYQSTTIACSPNGFPNQYLGTDIPPMTPTYGPYGEPIMPSPLPKPLIPNANLAGKRMFAGGQDSGQPLVKRVKASFVNCEVCNLTFNSESQASTHFGGSKHKNALAGNPEIKQQMQPQGQLQLMPSDLVCTLCNITFNSASQAAAHYGGSKHLAVLSEADPNAAYRSTMRARQLNFHEVAPPKKIPTKFVTCSVCKLTFNSQAQASAHFAGSKHLAKATEAANGLKDTVTPGEVTNVKSFITCDVCNLTFNSQAQADAHNSGTKHKKRLKKEKPKDNASLTLSEIVQIDPKSTTPKKYTCNLCCSMMNSLGQYTQHLAGQSHNNRIKSLTQTSNEFKGNKHGWFFCSHCNISVPTALGLSQHTSTPEHKKNASATSQAPLAASSRINYVAQTIN